MTLKTEHVLSVAVATGKVGYVFLIDGVPYDWGVSVVASQSQRATYEHTTDWIAYYAPELVVKERINSSARKGSVSRELTNSVLKAAQDSDVAIACVDRVQRHQNKYVEAAVLTKRFPELEPWLPRTRRLWDAEPRSTIIFEALALALTVIEEWN